MTKADINMDDRYARCGNPTEAVRVVCVDAPGNWPVLAVTNEGVVTRHRQNGEYLLGNENYAMDLVPLAEPLLERWANIYEGSTVFHHTKASAEKGAGTATLRTAVHMREVRDD